jgi:hypothetical protein
MSVVLQNVGGILSAAKRQAFAQDRRILQLAVDTYYATVQPNSYPTIDLTVPGVISFTRLVNANELHGVPMSASPAGHADAPDGGSYVWYLDANGLITTTFTGSYP